MNQETGESKFDRPLIAGEVLLFSEENYGGQEQLVTANTSSLDFPIASLRIGPKTGVIVFWEENYRGESQELTAELPSIKDSKLQGDLKSIKIWKKLGRPLISGEVLLCEEENYGGQEQLITANTSSLNFSIASLRIGPKTGVTVFSAENYGGVSQELTAELPSFQESRLKGKPKSIRIWSAPGKAFTGYWAIGVNEQEMSENVENVYLSVGADGVLTTSSKISEREQFRFIEGFTGWASSSYLKQVTPVPPPPPGGKYRATANRVHLREGPGTGFRSLGYIQVDELVTDLGLSDNGSWRQVLRHDGQRGWVSARYFTLLQSAPSDPGEAIPQDASRQWYRATAKLNVREGAGTNFTAIGSLQGKEIVEALEANADGSWLRLRRIQDPAEAALGRRRVTFSVSDPIAGQTVTSQPGCLALDDFRNLTMVNEQEAGFRKFSLLSQDNQWIHYSPEEKHFLKSADAGDRTIFCQSIKIATDETQVGELLQGEVALFENVAYWGKAWVFHTACADFNSVPGLNNTISSIQLGPLTGATIYRGARFSVEDDEKVDENDDEKVVSVKGKQDVVSSLSSLVLEQVGEDRISSIKIWQIKEPAALKLSFECRLSQDYHKTGDKFEEYSAYRTTLRLPPTVKTVRIWATDATTIEVDGKSYDVDETEAVKLDNPIRGMVITTNAVGDSGASLRTPGLKIWADTMLEDERIMIYPDQQVHKDLANLRQDDLWNATCGTDKDGKPLYVVAHPDDPDQLNQQQQKAASAQAMITKVMSTVQYSTDPLGGRQQRVSPPDEMQNKGWVLHFLTYLVTADTLNMREGPGAGYKPIGFLERNDIVQALEFSADGKWTRVRRLKDDLTGWCSSAYLKTGERYRVTASKLHLREGPGVDFSSLGYLQFNEIVTGIDVDDTGGWRQIRLSDGRTGWSAARYFALMEPPPPSPVSAVPLALRFGELSQEQVQALHAAPPSPGANLAQGWLDVSFADIVNAVTKAVTVAVTVFDGVLHLIVEGINTMVMWVADAAEKVIAFVEGVFGAIGATIENVIKWLRFVFDWGDILTTQGRLQEFVLQLLEDLDKTLAQAEIPVKHFFADQKHALIDKLDETIVALGGNVYRDAAAPSSAPGDSSNGILNTVDWILSKVLDGLDVMSLVGDVIGTGNTNATETKEDIELRTFCDETIKSGMDSIGAMPQGMLEVISTLVNNLDKPLLFVAKLLELLRDQVVRLINASEGIVLGMLKIMSSLIKKIQDILTAKISIPFISDICKWIKESGLLEHIGMPHLLEWMGDSPGTLPFTLLDAITLIIAVPSTIFYKACFGKAPFQDVQALAPLALEAADPDPTEKALGFMGAISSAINGVICAISDGVLSEISTPNINNGPGKPKTPDNPLKYFLDMCSFVLSVISWLFSLPGRCKELAAPKESTKFEWISCAVELILLSINAASTVIVRRKSKESKPEPLLEDDVANTLTVAFGLVHAQFFWVKSTTDPETSLVWDFLPGMTGILPEIASLFKLPAARSYARYVLVPVDLLAAVAAVFSIFAPNTP
jgi:uncharacterized protein YgiM (DUF1202 family)